MGEKLKVLAFCVAIGALGWGFIAWFDGWPAWLGGGMMVFAVLGAVGAFQGETAPPRSIYCADCGQFLGKSNGFDCPCPRCGCNRYTRDDPGIGVTHKAR